jgi:Mrp family chromosome partitioning ATPase
MVDLSAEMSDLWTSLGAPAPGRPRLIQVAAARGGEGTSTVARELALHASRGGVRSVWLIDLDLLASPQYACIRAEAGRYGSLGPAVAATPDGSMFFTVQPSATDTDGRPWPDAAYLAAYRVGVARLWVTRFRRETLKAGQTVHVLTREDYWQAIRRHADLVIVDAPAADRSHASTILAPFMDQTILVVSADQADVRAPAMLRDAIIEGGGAVAGLFFNRGAVTPPSFLKGLLP